MMARFEVATSPPRPEDSVGAAPAGTQEER